MYNLKFTYEEYVSKSKCEETIIRTLSVKSTCNNTQIKNFSVYVFFLEVLDNCTQTETLPFCYLKGD